MRKKKTRQKNGWAYLLCFLGTGAVYLSCVDQWRVYEEPVRQVRSWCGEIGEGSFLAAVGGKVQEMDWLGGLEEILGRGGIGGAGDSGTAGVPGGAGGSGAAGSPGGAGGSGAAGGPGGAGGSGTAGGPGEEGGAGAAGNPGGAGDSGTAGNPGEEGGFGTAGGPEGAGDSGTAGGPEGAGDSGAAGGPEGAGDSGATGNSGGEGGPGTAGVPGGTGEMPGETGSGNSAGRPGDFPGDGAQEVPGSGEPEYLTVEDDYFSDAVFIGDSRTVGMFEYGGLEEISTFYASKGLTVYKMFDSEIVTVPGQKKKITVEEALQQNTFAKIYLMIGINEMGTGTVETFMEKYQEVVAHLRELQPDAILYLQGIIKVTAERSAQGDYINNEGIVARNEAIAQLADNDKIFYLDVNPLICDETEGMNASYTFDGVHLKAQYIEIWKDYLKTHAISS